MRRRYFCLLLRFVSHSQFVIVSGLPLALGTHKIFTRLLAGDDQVNSTSFGNDSSLLSTSWSSSSSSFSSLTSHKHQSFSDRRQPLELESNSCGALVIRPMLVVTLMRVQSRVHPGFCHFKGNIRLFQKIRCYS
jgi:hypothetical protein